MNPGTLALTWALAGIVGSALVRRVRLRRLGAMVPLACGAVSLTASGLDRTAAGLLVACSIAVSLTQLLATALDGAEPLVTGLAGAATVLVLSSADPLVEGLALVAAGATMGIRWLMASPGRATLAAARVPLAGAAAIAGAAVFLPVPAGTGPRSSLAAGLLLVGLAGLLALVPLGGWAAASAATLRSGDIASWALLIVPAVLLRATQVAPLLPQPGVLVLQHGLLILGLLSAVWSGLQAVREQPGRRYIRVLLADVALFAAGIGSTQPQALSGGLLLLLTHLVAAPLLLQGFSADLALPRRLVWLGLTGLPPAPIFWGRFLILEACAAANVQAGLIAALALGLLFLAAVLVVVRGEAAVSEQEPGKRLLSSLAWVLPLAALVIGVAPAAASRAVFGGP